MAASFQEMAEGLTPTADDVCDGNVTLRAGYLIGMASKLSEDSEDRVFLLRAARSLRVFAERLRDARR